MFLRDQVGTALRSVPCLSLVLWLLMAHLAAQDTSRESGGSPAVDAAGPRDSIRRFGPATAPWQADLILDVHCLHCADVCGATLAALRPLADAGQLAVVVRWWPRQRDADATSLVEHLLAAADPAEFRLLCSLVVGTPEGRGWAVLRPRLAELVDPQAIDRRLEAHRADITAAMASDAERVRTTGVTSVPSLILSDRQGVEVGRWAGSAFTVDAAVRLVTVTPSDTHPP